ncbi:MAG: 50S ribosomal protein L29 [Nitrospirae bacterium]|nr:MAG: 50S ribosomal protein L29 [Nitrospirota bacterium]
MDVKELKEMELAELAEKERKLKQEMFNLRFQLATGRIENPMKIRQTRRDLARVKTIMQQKTVGGAASTGKSKG